MSFVTEILGDAFEQVTECYDYFRIRSLLSNYYMSRAAKQVSIAYNSTISQVAFDGDRSIFIYKIETE